MGEFSGDRSPPQLLPKVGNWEGCPENSPPHFFVKDLAYKGD